MQGIAAILARLDIIENRQIEISTNIRLNNALIYNQRVIGRNFLEQPNCQPLKKTVYFLQFFWVTTS